MLLKSLIIMDPVYVHNVYGPDQINSIESLTVLLHPPLAGQDALARPDLLNEADILFTGWGCCTLDSCFLSAAPKLKAVFYGAGTVRSIVTPVFWKSGILLTSAFAANAVPVAEFSFAQIILALKKAHYFSRLSRENERWEHQRTIDENIPGCYGTKVGLVSLGMIGRLVLDFLQHLDVQVKVFDIIRNERLADEKHFQYVSLEDIFKTCDVVSLHAPDLPATRKMITEDMLSSMRKGAALINTARGAIIDEEAMIRVLRGRLDLTAHLDVLTEEPPCNENPLFSLPNVYITPHLAGSKHAECRRMGQMAVEECRRFLASEEPGWQVTEDMLETMA